MHTHPDTNLCDDRLQKLTPIRGRKLVSISRISCSLSFTETDPDNGTKTKCSNLLSYSCKESFTETDPDKGTKTSSVALRILRVRWGLQKLTPIMGRKLCRAINKLCCLVRFTETDPDKGTKTRKAGTADHRKYLRFTETDPDKGTKTILDQDLLKP